MTTPGAPPPRDEEARGNGRNGRNGFPIVGIGASAGGLEAASQLLAALPGSTGLAYVVVQHLDPHHRSQLTELLGRVTSLPVVDATDGVSVEPDRVYVIPPDAYLSIEQGVLQLTPRGEERAPLHAIDHFFRSLASDRG